MTSSRGMTFVESLVWVAVLSAAMIALSSSLLYFYRANDYAIKEAAATVSGEHAMDAAVKAIRTTSYANDGAYPVISIAGDQVVFYAPVNKNDPLTQRVRFFLTGTSFQEGITEPSGDPYTYSTSTEKITDLSDYVLNSLVGTSTFFYYDQNGNPVTDYSRFQDVRFVTINLIVDASTSSLPTQFNLRSSAALRILIAH